MHNRRVMIASAEVEYEGYCQWTRVQEIMVANPFITRKDYSGITGLMQNNTLDDLNPPMEKGILTILE